MTYTIEVEPYGKVQVVENVRCRRISLKIISGKLRLAVPSRTLPKEIASFFSRHKEQIDELLERVEEKGLSRKAIFFKPGTEFHTRQRELVFEQLPDNELRKAMVTADKMTVYYPANLDFTDESFQKYVHKVIDAALKNEALRYLPARTDALAKEHGLTYDHVDVRNMTSQWGSCSRTGRICLNIQLMRMPDELIDLIILHELTHTIHFDHSKAFYADLDRFLGGRHDELVKEMKKYSPRY